MLLLCVLVCVAPPAVAGAPVGVPTLAADPDLRAGARPAQAALVTADRASVQPIPALRANARTAGGTVAATRPQGALTFEILESDDRHTIVEIIIPPINVELTEVGGQVFQTVHVPGTDPFGEIGQPGLPIAGTLIAVPDRAGVELRVLEQKCLTRGGFNLLPVQPRGWSPDRPLVLDHAFYASESFAPRENVAIGEPAILRDYRVVPLRVRPLSYNPTTGEITITRTLRIELDYSTPGSTNLKESARPHSPAFEPFYRSLIANYDAVSTRYQQDQRGKYLIITHDSFYDAILPLADWKHRRGMEVEIAKLSQIGSSSSLIKSYIQQAYDTWDVPPEYILIVGDTEYVPTYNSYARTDDYYCWLEGGDYLVDALPGRFSVDSVTQCELLVAKTLGYRRTPYTSDPDWFRSGCLIVRDDYDSSDQIYYADTWHAYGLMQDAGFAQIDTLFRKHGANASHVVASVNDGRTLINYRGQGVQNWWDPFGVNPNSTDPGFKLPVVMSVTCGTGSFAGDGYAGENWMRAGTATNPKGSVAFVATSGIVVGGAHLRSPVDQGFFSAIFEEGLYTASAALVYGKYQLYVLYHNRGEYEAWNVQGDPELDIWTATPQDLDVVHSPTVPVGQSLLSVSVETGGAPVEGALVCAYVPDEVYANAYTNSAGQVVLSVNPATADTMWVTVTGHNLHPYEGHAIITPEGPYLIYNDMSIDDEQSGNGDGLVNPGETIDFYVTLENVGPDPAMDVTGLLRSPDQFVSLIDTTVAYGNIEGGGTATNTAPYRFEVHEACGSGHELSFSLLASDSQEERSWTITMPTVPVAAGELDYVGHLVEDPPPGGDGDGSLEPGEVAELKLTLQNVGLGDLDDVSGILATTDPFIAVTDENGHFGAMESGGTATNTGNTFGLSVSPAAPPGHNVEFVLSATGDGGTYQYSGLVEFSLTLGGQPTQSPSGPDSYGYYAYDASDVGTGQAPVYSWIEIAPPGPGSIISAITNEDAKTTTVALPFTFRYYGIDYNEISICSNGFLAMGTEDYRFGDNSQIPNSHGPAAMIAPFWDDLDPSQAGDIYQWYDSTNHLWLVQFEGVVHYVGGVNPETFEAILYDPAYYPTATGDGEIVFQYKDVGSIGSSTVGIENHLQNDGIQYVYDNSYDPNAAAIVDGQAIKFSTHPPSAADIWLVYSEHAVNDSVGGDGDGIPEPGEIIDLIVTLENRGSETAYAVVCTLSTADPDAVIGDNSAPFGDIGSGAKGDNTGAPFTVEISGAPVDSLIGFDLHMQAAGGYDAWAWFTMVLGSTGTGIEEGDLPGVLALGRNFPNPFAERTTIAYELPRPARVHLEIYNLAGRKVTTILSGERPAGRHSAVWKRTDSSGRRVAAGIYFCRLEAAGLTSTKKMIVLK